VGCHEEEAEGRAVVVGVMVVVVSAGGGGGGGKRNEDEEEFGSRSSSSSSSRKPQLPPIHGDITPISLTPLPCLTSPPCSSACASTDIIIIRGKGRGHHVLPLVWTGPRRRMVGPMNQLMWKELNRYYDWSLSSSSLCPIG